MPLYEFNCPECRQDFELLVRSSRTDGVKCPKCGSARLIKKFSVFTAGVGDQSETIPPCGNSSAPCGPSCPGISHSH